MINKNLLIDVLKFTHYILMWSCFDEFIQNIDNERPSSQLSETLTSLWWGKKGDWDTAHALAQEISTVLGSVVHAYLLFPLDFTACDGLFCPS